MGIWAALGLPFYSVDVTTAASKLGSEVMTQCGYLARNEFFVNFEIVSNSQNSYFSLSSDSWVLSINSGNLVTPSPHFFFHSFSYLNGPGPILSAGNTTVNRAISHGS